MAAPGKLRGQELEVLRARHHRGELALECRLIDGAVGFIPARWTDLPLGAPAAESLGVIATPAGWRAFAERLAGLRGRRPAPSRASPETGEVAMTAQLALGIEEAEAPPPAVVWEQIPPERQAEVIARLAALLARLVGERRDD